MSLVTPEKNFETFEKRKEEMEAPQAFPMMGEDRDDIQVGSAIMLEPGVGNEMMAPFNSSPPVFSMEVLNDVLGDFGDTLDLDDKFGVDLEAVEQKFALDDIATIEQTADSVATALFNATQNAQNEMAFMPPPEQQWQSSGYRRMPPPSATVTWLPQLEHPLLETLLTPINSPIYPRVVDYSDARNGRDLGDASTVDGKSDGSDSDFELDGHSSSDDSSDSDFAGCDSDSDFGGTKRRAGAVQKRRRSTAVDKILGHGAASRKQPYQHHKTSKYKDHCAYGENPSAMKQINPHQLEQIASTMGSSPVTISWLLQNYETSEGNSLPRALMYGHYLRHCAELRLDPVNAASFGKLIRSVFIGLTTRRLGTRGNSKYHYCGIRIKDTSTLLLEDPDLSKKTRTNGKRSKKTQILAMQGVGICGLGGNKELTLDLDRDGNIELKSVKKYLGKRSTSFPMIDLDRFYIPTGISYDNLMYFSELYKKHCWEIMEAMEQFKLRDLETIWKQFWEEGSCKFCSPALGIPTDALVAITKIPDMQYAIQHWDAFTYDQSLSILMPNVIGQVPFQLLEEYHKFVRRLKEWLTAALASYDSDFLDLKMQLLKSFINELKSWISLNLSAQAVRDSMQSPSSIAQLLSDLNRINFRNVLMDVKEYINVDAMDINVHESLKIILSGPDSIEPWSVWLVGLVEQRLGMSSKVRAAPDGESTLTAVVKECQDLSLRWLKYMSQLKLELLLRSSGSLATFLSLELLFSNFLLHLIKVYKSRALEVPLVLYSIVRKSHGRQTTPIRRSSQENMTIIQTNIKDEAFEPGEITDIHIPSVVIKEDPDGVPTENGVNLEAPTLSVIKEEIFGGP